MNVIKTKVVNVFPVFYATLSSSGYYSESTICQKYQVRHYLCVQRNALLETKESSLIIVDVWIVDSHF